ncbi:MAG: phosphoribosylformylglycinamidine cyclo-ligase [Bdellovibrionota bacterium]
MPSPIKKKTPSDSGAESHPKTAYAKAGVDIVKADRFVETLSKMVKSTLNPKVHKSIGGYASLYQIGPNQFIAATTDGVGTKLKLGFELNRHHTVGIDLVAMSVNDLICVGATPLFFLDYFATGKLDLKTSTEVMRGIVEGCKQGRVALIGGETAEMPGIYAKGEYDLAGFAVGLVDRKDLIDGGGVKEGDLLLGLESSGPHSNGFSLIRKLLDKKPRDAKLVRECFEPTRIYVDAVIALRKTLRHNLKGLAHITGSGFLNIPRINDCFDYQIQLPRSFKIPKLFLQLKTRGKLSWEELYTTFNMGVGLVAVVSPQTFSKAEQTLRALKLKAHLLGRVKRSRQGSRISVQGPGFAIELRYD